MDVSIIIPAYNNERTIGSVLDALKKQEYQKCQLEIIVVDDKSKDSTVQIVSRFEDVRLVQNPENCGLGYSLNKGISLSKYDIVVSLHGDTVPLSKTWLSDLVAPLADPSIVSSCSIQVDPLSDRLCIWEQFLIARLDPDAAFNDKADAHKKSVLSDLGFYDYKTFRTAGEDEDLALRLRMANKKIVVTDARVLHDHYDTYSSTDECLKKLLLKDFTFGRAGGALRRKFPSHRLGSYVYPQPRSFMSDGMFRTIICVSCFIPFVQLVSLPVLVVFSLIGIKKTAKRTGLRRSYLLYPLFNIMRYMCYSGGYLAGLITKKQR